MRPEMCAWAKSEDKHAFACIESGRRHSSGVGSSWLALNQKIKAEIHLIYKIKFVIFNGYRSVRLTSMSVWNGYILRCKFPLIY